MKKKCIRILLLLLACIFLYQEATARLGIARSGSKLDPRHSSFASVTYRHSKSCGSRSLEASLSGVAMGVNLSQWIEAVNDQNTTWQDVNCSGNVLTNDFDPVDNLPLTFDGFIDNTGNLHNNGLMNVYAADGITFAGVLTVSNYGFYSFNPEPSFTGMVNVSYQIHHNYLSNVKDTGVLQIGVYPFAQQSNSVIATNDEYVFYGTSLNGNVIINDGDPQGHNFSVTGLTYDPDGVPATPPVAGILSAPVIAGGITTGGVPTSNAGTLALNSNGTFSFNPVNNFYGEIIFTYIICDAFSPAVCDSAILKFDIIKDTNGSANNAPFAGDDFKFIPVNNQVLFDFFANDYDTDGNPLSLNGTQITPGGSHTIIGSPVLTAAGGTMQFFADGNCLYVPPPNFSGPDFITYQICDNGMSTLCANATIYLLCGGDADLSVTKAAIPDTALTGQGLTYSIIASNYGPGTAYNVVIVDFVTAFPSPEYATNFNGPWSAWPGSFNAGTLQVNESDTIYIRGALSATACGSVTNVASVGSSTPDSYTANNFDRVMTIVLDPIPPTITCTSNQVRNVDSGVCTYKAVGSEFDPLHYSDNCGGTTLNYSLAGATNGIGTLSLNGVDLNSGTTTVTWTVTDYVGNTTACNFDILVSENIAPFITCAISGTQHKVADNSGKYTHFSTSWDATASDNCGLKSLTFSLSGATADSGTTLNNICFNSGITTVTWTASDSAGNSVSCSFDVQVNDTTNPAIICTVTGSQNVSADSNCKYTHSGVLWDATAIDNCGIQSLSFSLSGVTTGSGTSLNNVTFNKGTTTVTWIASDSAGNTVNCSFYVQVIDSSAPSVICAVSGIQIVSADNNCKYIHSGNLWDAVAADNCGIQSLTYALSGASAGSGITLSNVSLNKGLTTVTWTASDSAGSTNSCTFDVQVNDNTSPSLVCAVSGTQIIISDTTCKYIHSGTSWDATAIDNCGIQSLTFALSGATVDSGTSLNNITFNTGTTTVTWTATDTSGNAVSCGFSVEVKDTVAPFITCGVSGLQHVNANNLCSYVNHGTNWDATATDNCGVQSVFFTLSGSTSGSGISLDTIAFNKGTTTVTWTAFDFSGNNVSCSFDVHVNDTTSPSIICPVSGIQTVNTDSNCGYIHMTTSWDAISTDNCGVRSLDFALSGATVASGTTLNNISFNNGTTTVTWIASDSAGNSVSCSFDVQVNDTTPPVVSCPSAIHINSAPGACSVVAANVALGNPVASDNCGISATINNAPIISYTPGNTDVTWIITDNSGNVASCVQSVFVSCAPLAKSDSVTTSEDMPVLINELLNDVDCDNDLNISTVQVIINPAHGSTSVNPISGKINYSPNTNYYGADQFSYQVCDSGGLCSQAIVYLNIVPVNDVPVTVNEYLTITEDIPYTGTLLNGDFDPDGTTLDAQIIPAVNPVHGTIIILPNGIYTYTPFLNYNGPDIAVVTLCDHGIPMPAACSYDTLFFTVLAVNDPPVTVNEYMTTFEDTPVIGSVLVNGDYDPDGTALIATAIPLLGPSHGSINISNNGAFIYTPSLNSCGLDTVIINICDHGIPLPAACSNDTIFILTNPVNDAPVTFNEIITVFEDSAVSGNVLLNGDFDPDGTALRVSSFPFSGPLHGTFMIDSLGNFTYTPSPGYFGTDQVTVSICDHGIPLPPACSNDIIVLTVVPENDSPVTVNEYCTMLEDVPYVGSVLTNGDIDPDGTSLQASSVPVSGPVHGTIIIQPNGIFTYTPSQDYSGFDTIVISICDNGIPMPSACSNDTVFLMIGPVNDPPVVFNEFITIPEGSSYSGSVMNGDYDIDGTPLNASPTPLFGPFHGSLVISPNGDIFYVPTQYFNGSDTVVIRLCDSGIPLPGSCSNDTIFITVTPGNATPVTYNEHIVLCMDGAITGNVLNNGDWDPEGTQLTAMILPIYGPMHGIAVINSNGDFLYAPQPGFSGTDTIVVGIYDAGIPLPPAISNDTVFITVNIAFAADGGPSQQWCGAMNTFLTGNQPAGTIGSWSQLSGPNTVLISPQNAAVAGVSGMINGTYTFVYSLTSVYSSGNCASFDTVSVINFHYPSLSYAGPDQVICSGNGTASAILNGNVPIYGQGVWVQMSGPTFAIFSDSLSNSCSVSNLIPGDYIFNWCIRNGVCAVEYDYVHIHVNAAPFVDAGSNVQTCQAMPIALSGATASNYQSLQWVTSGTGVFSNPIVINPVYYPSLADALSGSVVLTLIAYGNSSCSNVIDTMILTVVANPALACPSNVIENADSGQCGAYVNVPAPNLIAGNGCVLAVVNSHNGTSDASGIYPVGSTSVIWTVTFANGAMASCSHTVTVNDTIKPAITCPGNSSSNILSGCDAIDSIAVVLVADNCSISSLTWAMSGATFATSPPVGINQVGVYTFNRGLTNVDLVATDHAGNSATCSFTITVLDTIIPTITCPAPVIAATTPGSCAATGIALGTPTASDNCSYNPISNNAPSNFMLDTTIVLYTVTDSSGNVAGCSQIVVVRATPYAAVDIAITDEDVPVLIDVLSNDSDCDSNINPGSVSVVIQPLNGTTAVDTVSGEILYTPNPNFFGTDQFDYQVCDSTGLCSIAVVYINVLPVNDPPVVSDSAINMPEDSSITICLPVIDPDGPFPLILSGVNCTSNGYHSVSLVPGSVCITYTPFSDFTGIDTVCVLICDSLGLCDVGMLIINVLPVNDPPHVSDTLVNIEQDSTLAICITIYDVDGAMPFSGISLGCADSGLVNVYVNLDEVCIEYFPDSGFVGMDTVCIMICDSGGACSIAQVYINVYPHQAHAVIGLAKLATAPEYLPDGTFDVTFEFTVCNLGNRTLYNVQVADNLRKTFPAPVQFMLNSPVSVGGNLISNCHFNGVLDTNLLFAPASYLLPGQMETITVNLKIIPNNYFGLFMNSACANANDTSGSFTWDISNRGTVADFDGDGNPNESGENNATPVFLQPQSGIGLAKAVSNVEQHDNGSFDITYVITVQNMAFDSLSNIRVTDALSNAFPSPVRFSVIDPPAANSTLTANTSFDGITDINLLVADASYLEPRQSGTITFTLNVYFEGVEQTFYNSAFGEGIGALGISVSDSSDNGYSPDANGNGKADDAGENEPTPLRLVPLNVFIPDGFSPDGDGINDFFVITGISRYPECRLWVYNRWGNIVFNQKAYNNNWDGRLVGSSFELGNGLVPQGTYYYILEFNTDGMKPATGFIVIKY